MEARILEVKYVREGDLLCLWNDFRGPVKGADVTTRTVLAAFHSEYGDGKCQGFDLYDAAGMLLPFLRGQLLRGELCDGELCATYSGETDTLVLLSNRHTVDCDQPVAKGLTAHLTKRGWAAGFTLERAAELLLPHLETWRPLTDEEMAGIQKRMAEHDAAIRQRMASNS